MDCHMPVMDGYAATRAIRGAEQGEQRVPIVAFTANSMAEEKDHCIAAGMDDFLSKPVDKAALEIVLARWLAPPCKQGGQQSAPQTTTSVDPCASPAN
jgi:CheY-like chemotaxis protein